MTAKTKKRTGAASEPLKSLTDLTENDLIAFQDRIRKDPVWYFKEYLGVKYWWPGMYKILEAIPRAIEEHKPIVIGSGHALSKDFTVSGRVPLWFAHAYAPQCKVNLTAPTDRQVKEVMWSELESAYNARVSMDPFGRLLKCKLDISSDWYILAFTTKEIGGKVGKFQGFHSPAQCVIVSEGQAVNDNIYDQIDGVLTGEIRLLIILGNPVTATGRYAAMLKDTKRNIVINLSCLDSPNVLAGREVIPGMCSKSWVDDKISRWNADGSGTDPRWQGRVLGIVPTSTIDTVISSDLYDKALQRNLTPAYRTGSIGVDPAWYGDDDMVITVMESGKIVHRKVIPKCKAEEGCSHVVIAQRKFFPEGQIPIVIDCDGGGAIFAEMLESMIETDKGIEIVKFYGSCTDAKVVDPVYLNHRAESAFYVRSQMENGLIHLDDDELMQQEALEEKYIIKQRGKIQLEDKGDMSERLNRSPNRWDSTKLAIWGMKFAKKIRQPDRWKTRSSETYGRAASTAGSGSFMTA